MKDNLETRVSLKESHYTTGINDRANDSMHEVSINLARKYILLFQKNNISFSDWLSGAAYSDSLFHGYELFLDVL